MREYGIPLTRIFPYKYRIVDSRIFELYSRIFYAVKDNTISHQLI